jgi:hypothetical protein
MIHSCVFAAVKLIKAYGKKNFNPNFAVCFDGNVILAKRPMGFCFSFMPQCERSFT